MTKGRTAAAAAVIATALACAPAQASASQLCGQGSTTSPNTAYIDEGSTQAVNVRVTDMTCDRAFDAITFGHLAGGDGVLITRGFKCRIEHQYVSYGEVTGATDRCVSGRRSFSFLWAT